MDDAIAKSREQTAKLLNDLLTAEQDGLSAERQAWMRQQAWIHQSYASQGKVYPPVNVYEDIDPGDEQLQQYSKDIVFVDPDTGIQIPEFVTKDHEILKQGDYAVGKPIHQGIPSSIYGLTSSLILKFQSQEHEFQWMQDAGDVSIKPISRLLWKLTGRIFIQGIIMERGTPLDFLDGSIPAEDKAELKAEMIAVVAALHGEGIAHGDIKPDNFLRNKAGALCLCDFACAFRPGTDSGYWKQEIGVSTPQYTSPNRGWPEPAPPSFEDDMYALAMSVWELYTGKRALSDVDDDLEDLLPQGYTVDVNAVDDEEVRSWIKGILMAGGAKIP